jgi:hypothetical protein
VCRTGESEALAAAGRRYAFPRGQEVDHGAFGLLAGAIAVLDWFAILFTGHPLAGLQGLKRMYLGWRARALAYCALIHDQYPPFALSEEALEAETALPPSTAEI